MLELLAGRPGTKTALPEDQDGSDAVSESSKRRFRGAAATQPRPSYPTHDAFEPSRREFLGRLGALLGAGALAALLPACGDRAVGDDPPPDMNTMGGKPDMMPAPADVGPELRPSMGVPDMMYAPVDGDVAPPPEDFGLDRTGGKPDMPRAKIDGE